MLDVNDQLFKVVFDTPSIGKISVTEHVVDQLTAGHLRHDSKRVLESLVRRLNNTRLYRQPIPNVVMQKKRMRYSQNQRFEFWGSALNKMYFLVRRAPPDPVVFLLAIYQRHPALDSR